MFFRDSDDTEYILFLTKRSLTSYQTPIKDVELFSYSTKNIQHYYEYRLDFQ
jgi:hypothetical protein